MPASTSYAAADRLYRLVIFNNFFSNGLGDPRTLASLCAILGKTHELVSPTHPIHVHRASSQEDHDLVEGSLVSPLALLCPDMVPDESVWARFQFVLPKGYLAARPPLQADPVQLSQDLLDHLSPNGAKRRAVANSPSSPEAAASSNSRKGLPSSPPSPLSLSLALLIHLTVLDRW